MDKFHETPEEVEADTRSDTLGNKKAEHLVESLWNSQRNTLLDTAKTLADARVEMLAYRLTDDKGQAVCGPLSDL